MKHGKYSVSLMVVLVMALALIGCAKPPEAEKSAADAAKNAAIAAGAETYAATDLDAAKKILDGAEAQMKEKNYKEAKQAYLDAKAAFERAAAAVAAGKQAAAAEATAAVTALEQAWVNLEAAAKPVEKKLKEKKDLWSADVAAFTEGLTKVKEGIAADPAGAKAKIAELQAIIDKWDAAFKELAAAAPAKPAAKKK